MNEPDPTFSTIMETYGTWLDVRPLPATDRPDTHPVEHQTGSHQTGFAALTVPKATAAARR